MTPMMIAPMRLMTTLLCCILMIMPLKILELVPKSSSVSLNCNEMVLICNLKIRFGLI